MATRILEIRRTEPGRFTSIRLGRTIRRLVAVTCLLALAPALAQEVDSDTTLTPELLQTMIRGIEDSTEVDDSIKTHLVELYGQSISNLELVRARRAAMDEYRQAIEDAPVATESIRASIERKRGADQAAQPRIASSMSFNEIDQRLQEELANLAAAEAELSALNTRLDAESQRPAQASERIAGARRLVEEVVGQADPPSTPEGDRLVAQASRWSSETRLEALHAEIAMLDQELLSQPARVELLKAQRDEAALNVSQIRQRVEALRSALRDRRLSEAEVAKAQAKAVLEAPSGQQPIVRDLIEANLSLVDQLWSQVEELDSLSERESRARPQLARLAEAFRSTQRRLRLDASGAPLGLAIREQRRHLPDAREYARERRDLHKTITAAGLRLIESEDGRRALGDPKQYVEGLLAEAEAEPLDPDARADLEALAATRRELLDRAIANGVALQLQLYALDDTLRQLEERTTTYDQFLAEHLIWVRSTPAVNLETLGTLPHEIAAYLSPTAWLETARLAARGLWRPACVLMLLLASLILGLRKRIRTALIARGKNVGRIRRDSMSVTFEALGLTLLLALPGPLVLAAVGWALATIDESTSFSDGVATALLRTASLLLLVTFLRVLFEPGGVAERHFRWDCSTLADVRRQLAWFQYLSLPLYFLTSSAVAMSPATSGGSLGLLAFTGVMASLVAVTIGLAHPTRGAVRHTLQLRPDSKWWRYRYAWFPLVVAVPVMLAVLALAGFTHTAVELLRRLFGSILVLTAVRVVRGIVRRWLLMTRRRLAYDAAVAAREAARAARLAAGNVEGGEQPSVGDIGDQEVDLVALDADSRRLLNAAVTVLAILGLIGIWENVFPALGILENVTLWNASLGEEGARRLVPITLADLLLATLIALGGYFTAKNLPSLTDIILLKRGTMTAGGRYAVSTLSRYAIVTVTTVLTLGALGASWGQMGWAVAALSVGIGFGLQEIVANFICGLILLFERPVRVGDVVTVGGVSGTVTRIRIRATTIRDWERKELVVPNKQLITGQLLNWTLSDSVTRVEITVGVAYGTNVERAMALLHEAARENEHVLEEPAPGVSFEKFGDSSLILRLRAYIGTLADRGPAITELHGAIDQKLGAAGIVMAFPQRDVHLVSEDASTYKNRRP